MQQSNTMYTQTCWAPKLRHQSLHIPTEQQRKPIEIVIPTTKPFVLEPRHYTYPKPSLERKESKIEITTEDDEPSSSCVTKKTTTSHCCAGCHQPLRGQVVTTATNKFWHSSCFKCRKCSIHLEHIEYYEKEDVPYCAPDFHELFSPQCEYCKTPIEGECKIVALGKSYHVGHAFCRECGQPFEEDDSIFEKDGHGYCEKDYTKLFAKVCKGCSEYITEGFIKALGGEWHTNCFVCVDCGSHFTSMTFQLKGGKPYCGKGCQGKQKTTPSSDSNTTKKSENKTCYKCQKPIKGRCSSAFGHDYHPIHFQCSQCEKVLSARLTGLFESTGNHEIICKACVCKK